MALFYRLQKISGLIPEIVLPFCPFCQSFSPILLLFFYLLFLAGAAEFNLNNSYNILSAQCIKHCSEYIFYFIHCSQ